MTKEQINDMFSEAISTKDYANRKQLLDLLVKEDSENPDVQAAQAMLGGLYCQGRGGVSHNPVKAEALLINPARHGHSQALLQLALIHYQAKKPDAIKLFCQALATGGNGAEAAAAKLEELRRAGTRSAAFLQIFTKELDACMDKVKQNIQEGKDLDGSMQIALALYYIYDLCGPDSGNLQMAYGYLLKAQEKGNALVRIYLERTAFAHMEHPQASARLMDANKDYAPRPEPDSHLNGDANEDSIYEPEAEKSSFFSAINMPSTIYGPYNHTYRRFSTGTHSADYICDEDSDMVTIRDEDISMGAMGYSANTSSGYFYW